MEKESTEFNNRELFGVIYSAKVQKEAVWAKFAGAMRWKSSSAG